MRKIIILSAVIALFSASCSSEGYSDSSASESGQGGSMARFTIRGDYLYTVDHSTLKTFDISTASNPRYLKGKDQTLGFGIETVFVRDTLLFIGSQTGMYIYNVKRPDFPQQLASVAHIRSCDPVVAQGNYAYVTLNSENTWCGQTSNLLNIYDISNPSEPELIKTQTGFVHPRGLAVDGNKLFICDNGLKVYDVSNPVSPVWVDDITQIPQAGNIDTYDAIPLQGTLLVIGADGLYQFDYGGEKLKFLSKIAVLSE